MRELLMVLEIIIISAMLTVTVFSCFVIAFYDTLNIKVKYFCVLGIFSICLFAIRHVNIVSLYSSQNKGLIEKNTNTDTLSSLSLDTTQLSKSISLLDSSLISYRYFLVSYVTRLKMENEEIEGNLWFQCDNFPSKRQIDSMAYEGQDFKKGCFQNIIIKSIYEFKNGEDYWRYDKGFKQKKHNKKKNCSPLFYLGKNKDTSLYKLIKK